MNKWKMSGREFCSIALGTLLLALVFTIQVQAQTTTGTIVGTVIDQQGGAIPNAAVTLTNADTGEKKNMGTDANGNYRFVNMMPGKYKIDVEIAGFKHFTRDNILLDVENTLRIDASMQVGQVAEVVEVSSAAPLLQTEGGTLSQVVESRTVTEMPLNGRNVMNLIALTPGVIAQGSAAGSVQGNQHGATYSNPSGWGNYQIGGGMAGQSAQFLDAVPLNISLNNGIGLVPTQDAVQEFRVSTSNVSPEFGGFAGGVVNMATKSGNNEFHGTAYEFVRNNVFNANNFFNNEVGTERPEWTQNQYGAAVGGPLKKDKTFFYASWEGWKLRVGDPLLARVPTAAQQSWVAANGSPTAKAFYKMYMLPNLAVPDSKGNNVSVNGLSASNGNQVTGRLDHNLSDNQRLSVRYTWWGANTSDCDYFRNGFGKPGENHTSQQAVISDTFTLNPTTVVDGRIYVSVFRFDSMSPRSTNDASYLTSYGSNYVKLASQMSVIYNPTPIVLPAYGGPSFFLFQNTSSSTWEDQVGMSGSLTKIKGTHTLKFGGELRRSYRRAFADNNAAGQFLFLPVGPYAGKDAYDAMANDFSVSGSIETDLTIGATRWYYGFYAMDTWQVNRKLTLNLGLRWEQPGSLQEEHDRNTILDPNAADPTTFSANSYFSSLKGQLQLVNSSAYPDRQQNQLRWALFSPRVGLAYRISEKTVLRMGAGMSYLPGDLQGISSPVTSNGTSLYTGDVTNPFTSLAQPAGHNSNFMAALEGASISGILPDSKFPVAQQWNVMLGHEFKNGLMAEIGYAGSKGTHLPTSGWVINQLDPSYIAADFKLYSDGPLHMVTNPFYGHSSAGQLAAYAQIPIGQLQRPYPQFGFGGIGSAGLLSGNGGVTIGTPYFGNSSYNSLQAKLEKRFKSGGTILASYTWAKLITDTDSLNSFLEDMYGTASIGQNYYDRKSDRSLASYDVPHRFQVSYTYDLPIGHGQKFMTGAVGVVDKLVSGWGFNGQTTFQSGFPISISQATSDPMETYFGAGWTSNGASYKRPNVLPSCAAAISGSAQSRLDGWFNTSCFVAAANYTFGDESRVDPKLRNAGINNWDLAIFKRTKVKENIGLEFRAEGFNLFNRVQFAAPSTDINDLTTFGKISSQANRPRILQFALRLTF